MDKKVRLFIRNEGASGACAVLYVAASENEWTATGEVFRFAVTGAEASSDVDREAVRAIADTLSTEVLRELLDKRELDPPGAWAVPDDPMRGVAGAPPTATEKALDRAAGCIRVDRTQAERLLGFVEGMAAMGDPNVPGANSVIAEFERRLRTLLNGVDQ